MCNWGALTLDVVVGFPKKLSELGPPVGKEYKENESIFALKNYWQKHQIIIMRKMRIELDFFILKLWVWIILILNFVWVGGTIMLSVLSNGLVSALSNPCISEPSIRIKYGAGGEITALSRLFVVSV